MASVCLHRTLSERTRMNDVNGQNVVISCVSARVIYIVVVYMYATYVHSQTIFHNKCHCCCCCCCWFVCAHTLPPIQLRERLFVGTAPFGSMTKILIVSMFACYKSQIYIFIMSAGTLSLSLSCLCIFIACECMSRRT